MFIYKSVYICPLVVEVVWEDVYALLIYLGKNTAKIACPFN